MADDATEPHDHVTVAVLRREVELMQRQLVSVDHHIGELLAKVSNGLLNRMTILEQKMLGYESTKRWLVGILATLVAAMIISHVRNNQESRLRAMHLEQEILVLKERITSPPSKPEP
jgi:hypothetical protein